MPIAAGDVYQVKIKGTYSGEEMQNVFWYQIGTVGDETQVAGGLQAAVRDAILADVRVMQSTNANWNFISVMNWRIPAEDFIETDLDLDGLSSSEGLPSGNTYTFKSSRNAPGQHYSFKRFGACTVNYVTQNSIQTEGDWIAVADELKANISINTAFLAPIHVVFRIEKVNVFPPLGTGNPLTSHTLNGSWSYFVGSQASRKPGYGS